MVFGEITCSGELNIEKTVRNACREIGYDHVDIGFDHKNAQVIAGKIK